MNRALLTGLLLLLLVMTGLPATAEELPVPPLPPAHPLIGDKAPVPNLDMNAPPVAAPEQVTFDVRLYRATPYDPGLGFAPGSRYRSSEDRKPIQTPGLSVSVPLQ